MRPPSPAWRSRCLRGPTGLRGPTTSRTAAARRRPRRRPPASRARRSDMDRMTLTIDIQANDVGTKPVNLRSSLLVSSLITTIKDKFNLDGDFDLRLENSRQSLPAEAPLDQAGVTDGAVLICAPVAQDTGTLEAIERGVRVRLSKNFKRVFLQEERNL